MIPKIFKIIHRWFLKMDLQIFAVKNTQSEKFGDSWFEKVTPQKQEFVSDSPMLSRQTVPQRLQRDWMNPATVACWYHLLRSPDSFVNYILDFQIPFMVQMWLPTLLPFLQVENVPSSVWSLHHCTQYWTPGCLLNMGLSPRDCSPLSVMTKMSAWVCQGNGQTLEDRGPQFSQVTCLFRYALHAVL